MVNEALWESNDRTSTLCSMFPLKKENAHMSKYDVSQGVIKTKEN